MSFSNDYQGIYKAAIYKSTWIVEHIEFERR